MHGNYPKTICLVNFSVLCIKTILTSNSLKSLTITFELYHFKVQSALFKIPCIRM